MPRPSLPCCSSQCSPLAQARCAASDSSQAPLASPLPRPLLGRRRSPKSCAPTAAVVVAATAEVEVELIVRLPLVAQVAAAEVAVRAAVAATMTLELVPAAKKLEAAPVTLLTGVVVVVAAVVLVLVLARAGVKSPTQFGCL
mmetsp:Transcript_4239/g.8015  ORF Transcript_4239/g.8015 Transcript_4239/m.8015 type:complete len:142 (+) Transcript_4239:2136-2561(+)